ncbi:MAG: N,N-dimethylformamidase beta subunit family domain-containing protein [Acidimicrobiales bacterium]
MRRLILAVVALVGGLGLFFYLGSRPGPPLDRIQVSPPSPTTTTAPYAASSRDPVGHAGWIAIENAKPGTSAWTISKPQRPHSIEGYADHVSAQRGTAVQLFVSTTAPTFHVEAYRMGYYQGYQARLVWRSAEVPGMVQPIPHATGSTHTIECHWKASLAFTVGQDWPPGDYLLKLVGAGLQQQYVPLTVRDDSSHATYLVVNAVTTWQAYNQWGGYDLYSGPSATGSAAPGSSYATRSRAVSFDRPYDANFGQGAADFLGNELPLVSMVERLGLDVTYTTDVNLDLRPRLILNHKALLSLGHDEYWSASMRQGVIDAEQAGVNMAFLGANAIYRHIRFDSTGLGPDRLIICYKVATEDPLYGTNNAAVTTQWADPPVPRPESTIIGDMYSCNPVRAAMVIVDPTSWLFAGTGAKDRARLYGLVGSEYDHYDPALPGPRNVEILAHSPVSCGGRSDYADATYFTAPSGAGVFASGTNYWVPAIGNGCSGTQLCAAAVANKVTENLLAAYATGPAGVIHPSVSNWQKFLRYRPGRGPSETTTTISPAQG